MLWPGKSGSNDLASSFSISLHCMAQATCCWSHHLGPTSSNAGALWVYLAGKQLMTGCSHTVFELVPLSSRSYHNARKSIIGLLKLITVGSKRLQG